MEFIFFIFFYFLFDKLVNFENKLLFLKRIKTRFSLIRNGYNSMVYNAFLKIN